MKLSDFIDEWNSTGLNVESFDQDNLNWCSDFYVDTFKTVYSQQERRPLSISQLYKPFGFLLLDKFGIHDTSTITCNTKYHFMSGHMWESIIMSLMFQHGVDIHNIQKTVEFHGLEGHIDCMYGDDRVIDIKTMSPHYFKTFTESPNDNRGYLTQIACYQEALDVKYASVLCLNKLTGELRLVNIMPDEVYYHNDDISFTIDDLKYRASTIIDRYPINYSLKKVVDNFIEDLILSFPTARNGRYIVPFSLAYDSRRFAVWDLYSNNQIKWQYDSLEICKRLIKLRDINNVTVT